MSTQIQLLGGEKNAKDTHITHIGHTHPCPPQAHTLAQAHSEGAAPPHLWELTAEPQAYQKIRGPWEWSRHIASPLPAPRIKGPYVSDFT